jgi:hypothetical protein
MVDIENAENYTVQKLNVCGRKLETLPLNISRYTNLQTLSFKRPIGVLTPMVIN